MLQSNLSTRPFYNARGIRMVLLACVALLLALTAIHLLWARELDAREQTLSARATEAKDQASRLLADAQRLRAMVNPDELNAMSTAAQEVNATIEQRAFSWGGLLVQLERALPPDVRVTSIQPVLEDDGITVSLHVESKSDQELSTFMNQLERQGAFRNLWPVERHWGDELMDAVVRGTYVPQASPQDESSVEIPTKSVARRAK